jgi:molecular chaperone DnaK
MHVGIDLGTTFCCMAYIESGEPKVIPSSDGENTTPSVVWFDGRQAYVGRKANARKLVGGHNVHEFIKRDIGKPVEIPPNLYEDGDPLMPKIAPYEVDGFKYGAAGMSAIILRKLKKEAILHFKRVGALDRSVDEKSLDLDAVITVPAYFGDKERQETKLAGYAAGLNVIGIINEPTAAALAYGLVRSESQRIMVFDLGGGTFDVTILETRNGNAEVLSSGGDNTLGGRDWDAIIQDGLYEAFFRQNGRSIPDDPQRAFEIQALALQAKMELSAKEETTVLYSIEQGELAETLYRSAPPGSEMSMDMDAGTTEPAFYFEERATELLQRIRLICETTLAGARITTATGTKRPLRWDDIDELVLAGGASRMPMVPAMLERMSGRRIRRQIEGFDLDTAIAIGAALYGQHMARVQDVVSHGIGVKVMHDTRYAVEYLIEKDTPLPVTRTRSFRAGPRATLEVYEGESRSPDECVQRGRIELDNADGQVAIIMEADTSGILKVTADYPPDGRQVMELKNDLYMYEGRALPLRAKVQSLSVNL